MIKQVFLAPVPCVHLAELVGNPSLRQRVAFGTSKAGLNQVPIGLPVFIYASQPPHHLFRPGVASWTGTLGGIVKAVEHGSRSGKHPDPFVRPLTAETTDGPFLEFWEVLGLHQLNPPRALSDFAKADNGKPLDGEVPQWPILAQLDC